MKLFIIIFSVTLLSACSTSTVEIQSRQDPVAVRNLDDRIIYRDLSKRQVPINATQQASVADPIPMHLRSRDCSVVSFIPGSLRANIQRELLDCGYQIGIWDVGPDGFIDDWRVNNAYQVSVKLGVQGIVKWIETQYLLKSNIDTVQQTVNFIQPPEEQLNDIQ